MTKPDNSIFDVGFPATLPIAGLYESVRSSLTDGRSGAPAVTEKRAIRTVIETLDGTSAMDETNDAVRVNIVAGGAGGGGTSMVDDAPFTPGTTSITPAGGTYRSVRDLLDDNDGGAIALTQRRAVLMAVETPNGDNAMDDVNDALRVNVVAGAGSGGTAQADESAFVEGTTNFTPIGGVLNDTITSDPTEDQAAAARITAKRAIHVNQRNNAGAEIGVLAAPVRVDPTGTTTQPVSGTVTAVGNKSNDGGAPGADNLGVLPAVATAAAPLFTEGRQVGLSLDLAGALRVAGGGGGTQYTEDDPAIANPVGTAVSLRRRDALASETTLDGDITTANCTAKGEAYVKHVDNLPVIGTKSNNGGAPGATNIGTLPAVANAAAPTQTEGNQVGLSVDLTGALRVAGGGGGTQYTEDDVSAANPVGNQLIARRRDTPASETTTDGDVTALNCSANGEIYTKRITSAPNEGNVAHDAADSGNPTKIGYKAIAHGANPTAVAANDRTDAYANRAGVPFHIGGHPNIVTIELAATGTQTDVAIVTIGSGLIIVVTQVQVVLDEATTVGIGFRIGFGAVNTPTTTGVVATHPGMVPGSGLSRGDGSGILGIGTDGQDLRVTAESPAGGSWRFLISYYTIES